MMPLKRDISAIDGVKSLFTYENLRLIEYVFGFLLLVAILIWALEFFNKDSAFGKNPIYGIYRGLYWASTTVTTVGYGDFTPKTAMGRFLGMITQWAGIGIAGALIVTLGTSVLNTKARYDIMSATDLKGKYVATEAGTYGVGVLHELGAVVIEESTFREAVKLLDSKKANCVVFDTPVIMNFVKNEGAGHYAVPGPLFEAQYYGFLLPKYSPYKDAIDVVLLKLRENGIYDKIYNRWF